MSFLHSKTMNVLSLFDGLSGCQIALKNLDIEYTYYASEVDKYAIKTCLHNFPDTIQLGDVRNIKASDLPKIDLLVGGSPCQGFSFAGKQLNFNDERSKLFFEFVRILREVKPRYFLLENVKMKKEYQDVISKELNVEPILINSSLVSAQNRQRLYWTNINLVPYDLFSFTSGIPQPQDKGLILADILESGFTDREKSYCITANESKGTTLNHYFEKKKRQIVFKEIPSIVNKRVYNIDLQFNIYLLEQKKIMNLTISEISNQLNLPKTTIEHYFRTDNSRSYPNHEIYKKLKNILCLDNRFDIEINTYYEKQTLFEQNNRYYDINGLAPTLTTKGEGIKVLGLANDIKGKDQIKRIYSINGKAPALTTMQGGHQEPKIAASRGRYLIDGKRSNQESIKGLSTQRLEVRNDNKSNTLTTVAKDNLLMLSKDSYRKLTVRECARLQTIPDWFEFPVSNSQAYKMIGNGFTIDVISHILSHIE